MGPCGVALEVGPSISRALWVGGAAGICLCALCGEQLQLAPALSRRHGIRLTHAPAPAHERIEYVARLEHGGEERARFLLEQFALSLRVIQLGLEASDLGEEAQHVVLLWIDMHATPAPVLILVGAVWLALALVARALRHEVCYVEERGDTRLDLGEDRGLLSHLGLGA